MDKNQLPLPTPVNLPEGYILKRSKLGDNIDYELKKFNPELPFDHLESGGFIVASPNPSAPDDLITMTSALDPTMQRKGIGKEIYKLAERDTGKKIIPDKMLTERSSGIHQKYGLGKEFGLSDYEQILKKGYEKQADIINKRRAGNTETFFDWGAGKAITKEIPPIWPPQFADEEYSTIKKIMNSNGLDKFKSIIPLLKPIGMGLTALGAAGYSDPAAAAADIAIPGGLEELGMADERSIPDPRYQEYIRRMSQKGAR